MDGTVFFCWFDVDGLEEGVVEVVDDEFVRGRLEVEAKGRKICVRASQVKS
jgi:hypothetical protein